MQRLERWKGFGSPSSGDSQPGTGGSVARYSSV